MLMTTENIDIFVKDSFMIKLLKPVWIEVIEGLPEINVSVIKLKETSQGDKIEVPRWIANVLVDMGFAKILEEPFDNEVFKAEAKEKLQTPPLFAKINPDFYYRFTDLLTRKRILAEQNGEARQRCDKLQQSGYDLITNRLSKILSLTVTSSTSTDLYDKLSPEESEIFNEVRKMVALLRKAVLGDNGA